VIAGCVGRATEFPVPLSVFFGENRARGLRFVDGSGIESGGLKLWQPSGEQGLAMQRRFSWPVVSHPI